MRVESEGGGGGAWASRGGHARTRTHARPLSITRALSHTRARAHTRSTSTHLHPSRPEKCRRGARRSPQAGPAPRPPRPSACPGRTSPGPGRGAGWGGGGWGGGRGRPRWSGWRAGRGGPGEGGGEGGGGERETQRCVARVSEREKGSLSLCSREDASTHRPPATDPASACQAAPARNVRGRAGGRGVWQPDSGTPGRVFGARRGGAAPNRGLFRGVPLCCLQHACAQGGSSCLCSAELVEMASKHSPGAGWRGRPAWRGVRVVEPK